MQSLAQLLQQGPPTTGAAGGPPFDPRRPLPSDPRGPQTASGRAPLNPRGPPAIDASQYGAPPGPGAPQRDPHGAHLQSQAVVAPAGPAPTGPGRAGGSVTTAQAVSMPYYHQPPPSLVASADSNGKMLPGNTGAPYVANSSYPPHPPPGFAHNIAVGHKQSGPTPEYRPEVPHGPPQGTRLPFPAQPPNTVRGKQLLLLLSVKKETTTRVCFLFPTVTNFAVVLSTSIWLGSLPRDMPTTGVHEMMARFGRILDIQVERTEINQIRFPPVNVRPSWTLSDLFVSHTFTWGVSFLPFDLWYAPLWVFVST